MRGSRETRLTEEDVYEIAAEVAQEMITKFLSNLKGLIPDPEDVADEIQENYRREFRDFKKGYSRVNRVQESNRARNSDDEMMNIRKQMVEEDSTISQKQERQLNTREQFEEDIKAIHQKPESINEMVSDEFISQIDLGFDGSSVPTCTADKDGAGEE